MMQLAPPPPQPPAVEAVMVSRQAGSELVTYQDLPLVLTKGPRREDARVRRGLFITSLVTTTAPAVEGALADRYRWTYRSFIQRQICITSITGVFACTEAQVSPLTESAEGDAAIEDPAKFPLAEAARLKLIGERKARATALFANDRRIFVDPIFQKSGVTATAPPQKTAGPSL